MTKIYHGVERKIQKFTCFICFPSGNTVRTVHPTHPIIKINYNHRSSSARVFCALWWFFCILTTTLYRGGLIARLTVPEMSPTLNTLEQLSSSNLRWGMLDTYGSGYQLFRASTVTSLPQGNTTS